jgi:hypothetical protein
LATLDFPGLCVHDVKLKQVFSDIQTNDGQFCGWFHGGLSGLNGGNETSLWHFDSDIARPRLAEGLLPHFNGSHIGGVTMPSGEISLCA